MLTNHYYKLSPVTEGNAQNVEEFFNLLIKEQFSNKEAIKLQHKALMEYIKQPIATYFIRLYGSSYKNDYSKLRRGFLTEYKDGNRIVFCDNTFALKFAAAKADGLNYTYKHINSFFNQDKLVFSFGTTNKERELSYYSPKGVKRQNINPVGWTLAHIKQVGKGYNDKSLSYYFPNPQREEWDTVTKIRKIDNNITENELKVARAQFIRLVHPLNSFLVPKNNLVKYSGKRLGEEPSLIDFINQYLIKTFPLEMEDLERITMDYEFPTGPVINDINWSMDEQSLKTLDSNPKSLTEYEELNVDFDDELVSYKLLRTIRSIGMEIFRDVLYPILESNIKATIDDVISSYPEYGSYTINSQRSRLSSARTIFKNGLEDEALNIIDNSNLR